MIRTIAEIFLECGDWEQTRERVLSENSLQARSSSSNNRMEMEFRKRLKTLTSKQLEVLAPRTGKTVRGASLSNKFWGKPYVDARTYLKTGLNPTVADDFAVDLIDHILGNIGRQVTHPLQITGNRQIVDQPVEAGRVRADRLFDL